MSALDELDAFLQMSPSCIEPWEVRMYLDAIRNENVELRELVADMWRFTGTACKKYPRLFDPAAQGGQMVQPNMLDSLEQRMCELGIEVDDGQQRDV